MDDELRPAQPYALEQDLLAEVAAIIRQAIIEYQANAPIAGRLEITKAMRTLDCALHGERP